MTEIKKAVRLAVAAIATTALCAIPGGTANVATGTTQVPSHLADYRCTGMTTISPDFVWALGYNQYTSETVYWYGKLQKWSGSRWVDVPNSAPGWLS